MVKNKAIGIVFFDGDCNFCNASIDFVFKRNRKKNLRYSSLQSEFAKSVLPKNIYISNDFKTMYYIENKNIYSKSSAFLKIVRHLKLPYNLLLCFWIIPKPIRDLTYTFISRRRHKLVKKNTCRLTTKNELYFFINTADHKEKYAYIY
jgi:predicted DCC family thiol-disulfide oxidoreductase YuxK